MSPRSRPPDKPTYVKIHFEKGIPTAVDGVEMDGVTLIEHLNKLGGANGIGLLDIVENRLVGMKSRGVYETPGGAILYKAHDVLETITLDKESMHFKNTAGPEDGRAGLQRPVVHPAAGRPSAPLPMICRKPSPAM